ncbi:MAG: aminoglycoside phosphotransferase, partial [Bauldia sp.]|uniref:phosphotransferase enzyme family protein n=1 Tax=Bauldia sp. TaxID=2575872 RepID=UPI001DC43881|nr:aminoglycoside phosphotransferase [Bauldia sp.]
MTPFDDLPHEEQLRHLADLAAAALASWGIAAREPPALINLSENATYRVDDAGSDRRWAMRVHREGYHSRNAIASELAWLMALRSDGVVVTPAPVPGRDGELIQSVSHPTMARPRQVVLFQWESGEEPSEKDHLTDKFHILGEVT